MALFVLTYLGFRSRRYDFREKKMIEDEKAELTSWRSREDIYMDGDRTCDLRQTQPLAYRPYSMPRESDLTSSSEDFSEVGVGSKRQSTESNWFDILDKSSSLESLVRTQSIQDKALKISRRRHRHVKRKRNNPSPSTDTDENQTEPKRRPPLKETEERRSCPVNMQPEGYPASNSQEDSDNGSSSEIQPKRLTRTNSVQMKSWEIRRRRKAMLLKRKAVSFDDVLLQGVERSV